MTIPGTHPKIISNERTHFQKYLCTLFLYQTWTNSCVQADGQTKSKSPPPSINFVCKGKHAKSILVFISAYLNDIPIYMYKVNLALWFEVLPTSLKVMIFNKESNFVNDSITL